MIYNPIANERSFQKTPYINLNSNTLDHNNSNKQKHVTFRVDGRHADQIIFPTNKPQYHFSYGQQLNHSNNSYIIKNQYQNLNASYSVQPNFQTFYEQFSIDKADKKLSSGIDKSRSEQKKKKRLKIFPQKYQSSNHIKQKVQENDQVIQLKNQIEKLKLQIRNLSHNLSKNTSREFNQEQIFRNQAERTRRLSQLNEFNQKLYQELAVKLKQISLAEFENYLQKSNAHKMLYDSIYQNNQTNKLQDSVQKRSKYSQKFMDIKDFQEQYQRKYQSTGLQNIVKNTSFTPYIPSRQINYQIQSPFLLKQNKVAKWGQKLDATKENPIKNSQKVQSFTFNKQKQHQHRHFSQSFKQAQNDNFIQIFQKDKVKIQKNIKNQDNQRKKRLSQKLQNQIKVYSQTAKGGQKQIDDFNRELENKILKKRIYSQYSYINKAKKF